MPGQESISFLHLSDIHLFSQDISESGRDLDRDIRHQLEIDLDEKSSSFGSIEGILVTGDIAFQGAEEEYEKATDWLRNICNIIGISESDVWVVPGNHDIQRGQISTVLRTVHDDIKHGSKAHYRSLEDYLADDPNLLTKHLSNYNSFASKYGCDISGKKLYWTQSIDIDKEWMVRIRGVNSAITSNSDDDMYENGLVIGLKQAQLDEGKGAINLVMCHHPPSWLLDRDLVDDHFNGRAAVQLYGHRHNQSVQRIDESLRLVAGAVHPRREEGDYEPRYNFLRLAVIDDGHPTLTAEVHPRKWEGTSFAPDYDSDTGEEFRRYELEIDDVTRPLPDDVPTERTVAERSEVEVSKSSDTEQLTESVKNENQEAEASPMGPRRDLQYRYHLLPYQTKLSIALKLDLIIEEDHDVGAPQMFNRVLERAAKENKLREFWDEVESAHGDNRDLSNPFEE